MSGQFSANQFNDAFAAKRLGNWETIVRNPARFGAKRPGPTEIIADDRGHLLPHIPRAAFSSPWGDHQACVWEAVGHGFPPQNEKNQQKIRPKITPKLPKFFKKPTKLPKLPPKRPQGVKPAVDPILNQLRERRLPIIWMIGLPTEKIQNLREKFCEELSRALDYAYININDFIEHWKLRQGVRFAETVPYTANLKESLQQPPSRNKQQSAIQPASVCIPAQISPSLLNQVIAYDRTPDRAALAYASHVNIHRQSRQRQATAVTQALQQFDPVTGEEIQMNSPGNMIQFELGQPFTRDKLMDLLKFAMVESNPTKGYIIDGVFLEEGDGVCFEKMFYAPAVCTYITESVVNNTIDEWNKVRQSRPPAQDLVIDKQIKAQIKLIPPKYAKRNKKYSFLEVDKLCRSFETKLIRVLNAEEANEETIHFVYSLVYKHIKNYPNLVDEPKVNFFDPRYSEPEDADGTSDAFLSPVNSAITTSRTVIEIEKDPILEEIQEMINTHLPVIWVLGLKQRGTEEIRNSFCELLAKQMNFTYINLDDEILKWYEYQRDDLDKPQDVRSKVEDRVHNMSKSIVDKKETLTTENIIELLKYAMLLAPTSTTGYILDEFPFSMLEGSLFEQQLYPCTSLVYFLNFTWTTNKSVEPDVRPARNLHRGDLYSEEMVEKVCNHHGYKAIKVWNAEDLDGHGMNAISNIIAECINASRNGRVPSTHSQLGSPCFRNLIMPEDEDQDQFLDDQLYVNYFPEDRPPKKPRDKNRFREVFPNNQNELHEEEQFSQQSDDDEVNLEEISSDAESQETTVEQRLYSQSEVEEDAELMELNKEDEELATEVVDLTEDDEVAWSGDDGDKTDGEAKPGGDVEVEVSKKEEEFEQRDECGGGDW